MLWAGIEGRGVGHERNINRESKFVLDGGDVGKFFSILTMVKRGVSLLSFVAAFALAWDLNHRADQVRAGWG